MAYALAEPYIPNVRPSKPYIQETATVSSTAEPATNGHDDGTAGSAAAMQPQLPDTAEPPEAPEVSR